MDVCYDCSTEHGQDVLQASFNCDSGRKFKCWKKRLSPVELFCAFFQNEKRILKEQIQADIDEKIHLLEEDRNNVDLSTKLWTDAALGGGASDSHAKAGKKHKRKDESEHNFGCGPIRRKKKPVTVTDILCCCFELHPVLVSFSFFLARIFVPEGNVINCRLFPFALLQREVAVATVSSRPRSG